MTVVTRLISINSPQDDQEGQDIIPGILTLIHDHEVGVAVLVNLANAAQQESDTGVLKS